jgi:hypothetical protein
MQHIEKNILEKYIISREDFSPGELDNIMAHLEHCAYCKDLTEKLTAFYDSVSKEMQNNPTERDKAFADKLLTRNRLALPEKKLALQERVDNALSTFVEIIEPYHRPLAQRFIRYIRFHPVRVASGFSLAAALVFATLLIRPMFKDTNPAYARAKDEFLVVYNQSGDELWRKHISPYYDASMLEQHGILLPNYLITSDIDNDSRNEVLALFGFMDCLQPMKNTLYCYKSDGTEKWHKEFHWNQKFGDEVFADNYSAHSMLVRDFDQDGLKDIITLLYSGGYYPCVVVKTDPTNGHTTGEYWSSGSVNNMTSFDYNNDGIDEIFLTGENNGYNLASLAILDPRYFIGHTPAPPSYTPHGVPQGLEQYYILFPRNDLKMVSSHKRNMSLKVIVQDEKSLFTQVGELVDNSNYLTLFHFNSSLECTQVDGEDHFVALHQRLEKEGKLTKKLDAQYYEDLRKSVSYWDGEKFVNTPTKNSLYTKSVNLP